MLYCAPPTSVYALPWPDSADLSFHQIPRGPDVTAEALAMLRVDEAGQNLVCTAMRQS
ncbi:MAG: hypothetical protein KJ638_13560 [Chloroflexi bacterium]|nr:hypothetical protein [Chloroflexota bacterium]